MLPPTGKAGLEPKALARPGKSVLAMFQRRTINSQLRLGAARVIPLNFRFGKFFLMFAMGFLIGILSFFYLVKFTEIHTKGYTLRKLEIERQRLLSSRTAADTQIAQERALAAVQARAGQMNMGAARPALFVKADGAVAMRGDE